MTDAPIDRRTQMRREVTRVEARDRRTIARVQIATAIVLAASTLLAWENHPRVEHVVKPTPEDVVREVGHSIGLATWPAGPLVVVLSVLALLVAKRLRRVRLPDGWLALAIALAALAVNAIEIVQGMLGRRDWLDHLSSVVAPSGVGGGVGTGVWLAALMSIALVANASTYLWLEYRLWRNNPAVIDEAC
jgi:hypothetical protein